MAEEKGISLDNKANVLINKYLESERHAAYFKTHVDEFRRLKLKEESDLVVTRIEFHHDEQGWRRDQLTYNTFGEVADYLSRETPLSLRAQLLFLSLNKDRPSRHFGSMAQHRHEKQLVCISAMVLCLLGGLWEIDLEALNQVGGFTDPPPWPKASSITLPSKVQAGLSGSDSVVTVTLTSPPTDYDSDMALYIFHPQSKKPRYDSITIFHENRPKKNQQSYWRGILACSTKEVMNALLKKFEFEKGSPQIEVVSRDPQFLMRYSKEYVAEQACTNIKSIYTILERLKYATRDSPSFRKANYVLHLQDHLDLMHALFEPLCHEEREWPATEQKDWDAEWTMKFKSDFAYILRSVCECQLEATKVHNLITSQVQGRIGYRTTLFAIIAAIYLPFSLTTGIFGMNIKEINGGTLKWWTVVALGLPLVFITIALPMSLDWLYRKFQTFVGARPKLSRHPKSLIFLGLVLVVVIILTIILSVLGANGSLSRRNIV